MTIVLKYTVDGGHEEQVELESDYDKINLGYHEIEQIDLSPLTMYTSLKELYLSNNEIRSIDLSPLTTCSNLNNLHLTENELSSIDLTPLASCTNLDFLYLDDNRLQRIDLSPLASCASLRKLFLDINQFRSIDLSPLTTCTNLQELGLQENQLKRIDLSPLTTCTNLQELRLACNQLQSINLNPLSACTNLQNLDTWENQLKSIDLSPLTACTNLQKLELQGNQLQSIDLSPLTACTNLQELGLQRNQLKSIDLSPLRACTRLERLDLKDNQLKSIDLSPLVACASLKKLDLSKNKLLSIDLSPLTFCTNWGVRISLDFYKEFRRRPISWLMFNHIDRSTVYQRPVVSYPWSFLHRVAEEFGDDYRVQQDILQTLGLKHYGFIDTDLRELFLSLSQDSSIESIRKQVSERIVEEIATTVDEGGAMTGLAIEELHTKHGVFAKSVQRIIELRQGEMQRVVVGVKGNEVDLRELYLTAYGYEVLTALRMRLITDSKGLDRTKKALAELGFKLKTGKTSVSAVQMSDELKQVIWWITENRGRPWSEIMDRTK